MSIKLTYFNARGRAELPRVICAFGKIKYQDILIEFPDWPSLTPSKFFFLNYKVNASFTFLHICVYPPSTILFTDKISKKVLPTEKLISRNF